MLAVLTLLMGIAMLPPQALVWQDEFNRFRTDVWSTRAVARTDSDCARGDSRCARTLKGTMILSVREDPEGGYLTGHIGTKGRKHFNAYGYYVARIKFPSIPGVLCGWWLQSVEEYATLADTEVDIVENGGTRKVHHSVWASADGLPTGAQPQTFAHDLGSRDAQAEWHDYGVLWEPSGYTFLIDGEVVGAIDQYLSDTPKYLVLSIKVPTYLKDVIDPSALREYKMRIKWVRVYR